MSWFRTTPRQPPEPHPREAYARVLAARRERYGALLELVARAVYVRVKLEAEIRTRKAAIARLEAAAVNAGVRGDDRAIERIGSERTLQLSDLSARERALLEVRREADAAKSALHAFAERTRALDDERLTSLGLWSGLEARQAIRAADGALATSPELDALASVRTRLANRAAEHELDELLHG